MEYGFPTPIEHRDRGLARLNDLTVAVAIGATGLLGAFAIIAATTVPGHSDGTALAASGSNDQSQTGFGTDDSNGQAGFQQPNNNSFTQAGSSAPIAVSGGSR
jgi:hypothetical protein